MSGVNLRELSKVYTIGSKSFFALENVSLFIEDGSFTTVIGRSGCGKTTLLRLLCGLEEKSSGDIGFLHRGKMVNGKEVRIGVVFQEPRLMPWLTVKDNIRLSALSNKKEDGSVKTEKLLEMLGLEPFKNAYPSQISGGMAQRAALGRALFFDPDIILMDEPFGALDYFTRQKLQNEIVNLYIRHQKTILLVTHDIEEAVFLSQKIVVLEAGQLLWEFNIDLPYPRSKTDSRFLAFRDKIYNAIMGVREEELEK